MSHILRSLAAYFAIFFMGITAALAQQGSGVIALSCTGLLYNQAETVTIDPSTNSIGFEPQPWCGVNTITNGGEDDAGNDGCEGQSAFEHVMINALDVHFSMVSMDGTGWVLEDVTISRSDGSLTDVEMEESQHPMTGNCTKLPQNPNAF